MTLKRVLVAIIIAIWAFSAVVNFPSHGTLTGWDNLHPEYNFFLNAKRALFGVWQEQQGVGHIGGHGYAATLPHTLILWLLSSVIPLINLRASFTLLLYLIGGLGAFALVTYLIQKHSPKLAPFVGFLSALYYLFNLGTIQQFYVQLEAFIIHYAALPWLLYIVFKLLDKWDKKTFVLFLIVSLLSTTQGFIPPLFVVYMLFLSIISLSYILYHKTKYSIQKAVLLLLATLCINAYWLLPVAHYTATESNGFIHAYNNILSTQSWIETNDTYGTLKDLPLLRGFLWQATDIKDSQQIYIYEPWRQYFTNPIIPFIGYTSFGIILMGLFVCFRRQKSYQTAALIVLFILLFILLASHVPILNFGSELLQKLPLIRQAFRVSFTKTVIGLALCYSIFFSFGLTMVLEWMSRFVKKYFGPRLERWIRIIPYFVTVVTGISLLVYAQPVFTGNLFYKGTKITVPKAYTQLFTYFQKQDPNGCIMLLPQGDHWGWDTFRWGYTGSGFLWFGLQQPILERAFDVWSQYNENYFWELSYALYSQNTSLLNTVIQKYDISWIVLDTSLVPYQASKQSFYTDKIDLMIAQSDTISLVQTIPIQNSQHDVIKIYRVRKPNSRISVISNPSISASPFTWMNQDTGYSLFGNYITSNSATDNAFYVPFDSLFTQREATNLPFTISQAHGGFILRSQLPKQFSQKTLHIPQGSLARGVTLSLDNHPLTVDWSREQNIPLPQFQNGYLDVFVPTVENASTFNSEIVGSIKPEIKRCDGKTTGEANHTTTNNDGQDMYLLQNTQSSSCFDLYLPFVSQKQGYVVTVNTKHLSGKPLTFQLINGTSQRTDTTVILPIQKEDASFQQTSLIIPPMQSDGVGYSIRLSNDSLNDIPSVNQIGTISLYPIPYNMLTGIVAVSSDRLLTQGNLKTQTIHQENFVHSNSSLYKVSVNQSDISKGILVLSQSFNPGWLAYDVSKCQSGRASKICTMFPFLFGTALTNHVLVNNWANGWVLEQTANSKLQTAMEDTSGCKLQAASCQRTIVLFYCPQMLEFLGFALLPLPFLYAVWPKRDNNII